MFRSLSQLLLLGGAVIATLAREVPLGENFKYEPNWLLGGAHQVRRRSPLFALGGISCASTPLTLSDPVFLRQRCSHVSSPYVPSWTLRHDHDFKPPRFSHGYRAAPKVQHDHPQVRHSRSASGTPRTHLCAFASGSQEAC